MSTVERAKELAGYLVQGGWPLISACASAGNSWQENNCQPLTLGPKDHGSDGLYQWRLDRLTDLKAWSAKNGLDWRTIKTQAAFHQYEMARDYAALNAELRAGRKPIETLTANICMVYERPAAQYANLDNRIKYAKITYAAIQATPAEKKSSAAAKGGAVIITAGGAAAAAGHHWIGGPVATTVTVLAVTFALLCLLGWLASLKKPVQATAAGAGPLPAPSPRVTPALPGPTPVIASTLDVALGNFDAAGKAWDSAAVELAKARAAERAKADAILAAVKQSEEREAAIRAIPEPSAAPAEPAPAAEITISLGAPADVSKHEAA